MINRNSLIVVDIGNITSGTKELDRLLLTNFQNIFGLVVPN